MIKFPASYLKPYNSAGTS